MGLADLPPDPLPPPNPRLAPVYTILGFVLIMAWVGVIWLVLGWGGSLTARILIVAIAGVILSRRSERCLGLARHHESPTAEDVLFRDRRPPIVYLRGHHIDGRGLIWWLGPQSFEDLVQGALGGHGPLIALAPNVEPRQQLQRHGIPRDRRNPRAWQFRVSTLIARAQLVLVVCGRGAGLTWELEEIHAQGVALRHRVVFLVPLEGREGLRKREARYQAFRRLVAEKLQCSLPDFAADGHIIIQNSLAGWQWLRADTSVSVTETLPESYAASARALAAAFTRPWWKSVVSNALGVIVALSWVFLVLFIAVAVYVDCSL